MAEIGVIGTGHIAAPLARHLAKKGHKLTVSRRGKATSAALAASHGAHVAEPQDVLECAEIVLLCLRPQNAAEVLGPLRFRADHQIVSVMAKVSRAELASLCAPAQRFVQTIPLGFVEDGGCPLAAFGDTHMLSDLFSPENPVIPLAEEAALNAHFAICAMVPGFLDLMTSGSAWLAAQTGDAERAELYTKTLIAGFLNTMRTSLATERDALATDGTLSLQMVEGLRRGGAHDALHATLGEIRERLS